MVSKVRLYPKDEVVWRFVGSFEVDPDSAETTKSRRESFVNKMVFDEGIRFPRAVVFEGPRVACWLCQETGDHHLIQMGDPPEIVKVRFTAPTRIQGLEAPSLLKKRWTGERCRLIHWGQRQVHDMKLAVHYAIEPRLHRVYARFMRAHLYDAVFGQGAHKLFGRR